MIQTAYIEQLLKGGLTVWLISYAIRRKLEVDVKLTPKEQTVRWFLIFMFFMLALVQGGSMAVVRVISGLLAMTLIAWPSLVRRLAGRWK